MWLSSRAANRLFAAPTAWKSPVKCRLMSSIGTTCAYPPPAAPPLTPNTGPSDGSRSATTLFLPMCRSASASPTVVVVFPSPAGVGVIAVTSTSLPSARGESESSFGSIFALCRPYCSRYSSPMPALSATVRMSVSSVDWAIWMSVSIDGFPPYLNSWVRACGSCAGRPEIRRRSARPPPKTRCLRTSTAACPARFRTPSRSEPTGRAPRR